jgi:hypothetical protein
MLLKTTLWGAALAAAVLFGACSNPAGSPDSGKDEPETPAPLGPGLYSYTGDMPPREAGEDIVKIPALPFTLANALAVLDEEIEDPPEGVDPKELPPQKKYLLIFDQDTLLQSWTLRGSVALTIRGLGGERLIQLYNAGTSDEVAELNKESLFTVRDGASLVLDENVTLLGSESQANAAPLVTAAYLGSLELRDGAKLKNNMGGGVCVRERNASFVMHGGEISGCVLSNLSPINRGGGGVQIRDGGAFIMKGGVIRDNRFGQDEFPILDGGGGVCQYQGSFIMEGGEITGNYSDRKGGGVSGDFTIRGGSIHGNVSGDPNPLFKNIWKTPVTEGDDFLIEGWNEPHELVLSAKGDAAGKPVTEAETGGRLEFSAAVTGVGTPSQSVAWSIPEPHNPYTTVTDGVLVIGAGETASALTVRAASAVDPGVHGERAVTIRVYNESRLWVKFGVDSPNQTTEIFNVLHEYIESGQLDGGNPRGLRVGDYYDLPHLTIAGDVAADPVFINNTLIQDGTGALRLVVAGINSFEGINGNTGSHLVFQFRNAVVSRRMNATNTNEGGYAESEMRAYLRDYFLPGLIAAGIPQDRLWNPSRVIAKGGEEAGADTVADYLWLPTALEMNVLRINELLGFPDYNDNLIKEAETRENQALLEYYDSARDADSAKSLVERWDMDNTLIEFWLASPLSPAYPMSNSEGQFVRFTRTWRPRLYFGHHYYNSVSSKSGVLPAFCVK